MGKKSLLKKAVAISIITIFLTTSILPTISGIEIETKKQEVNSQKLVEKCDEVDVTFYSFGLDKQSTNQMQMSYDDVEILLSQISEYSLEVAKSPQTDDAEELQQEIFSQFDELGILPDDIQQNLYNSLLNRKKTGFTPISILQNRASAFFCNFATTGTGSQFPVIIFPRLIPIIQLPIPRLFLRWTATNGITSCGGLLSGKGYIAYGPQKGTALGFWGIGFSVFLPPIMQYGFIGYALYATTEAETIELWPPNNPPTITPINPYNGEINVPVSLSELEFQISDLDGDLMSYAITTTPDIGSGSGNLKLDGIYSIPVSGLEDLTEYSWHIEVTDGMDTTTGDFTFTAEAIAPIVSNPSPQDGEKYVPVSLSHLSFHLKDFQGDPMDYTVETVPDIGSGSGTGVGEGTYSVPVSGLDYSVEYIWYVDVTDGEHQTNKIFNFQIEHEMTFDPFDEGWLYRKEITIDHTKVDGDLENFPILISTTDVDLRDKAQDDGDDILFMDGTGISNRLYHEIESYDESTGKLVTWVNVNDLYSYQDTNLYMYYGNPNSCNQQAPELVWDSDYLTVLHMNDDPDNSHVMDSTAYDNDGTKKGNDEPIETNGKISFAQNFDGLNDYIDTTDFDINDDFTMSLWIDLTSIQKYKQFFIGKHKSEKGDENIVLFGINSEDNYYFRIRNEYHMQDTVETGQQYLVAVGKKMSSSETQITYYKDGAVLWQHVINEVVGNALGRPWTIGQDWDGNERTDFVHGMMDEIRISNTIRDSNWISTEYNNQNDPSSFIEVGPEVPAP